MALRGKLQRIVDTLVDEHKDQGGVPLDALGDAIATEAVTTVEIDEMMNGLESSGPAGHLAQDGERRGRP